MPVSWVRKIRKACTFINPHHPHNKSKGKEQPVMDKGLQGEVMACAYEDVQVMWSILDMKSKPTNYTLTS